MSNHSPNRRQMAEIRQQAVQRVLNGESPSAVMQALGLNRSSIYPWLKQYRAEGLTGLRAKTSPGRTPKLGKLHEQQLKRLISNRSPEAFGLDQALWNTDTLAQLIHQKFNVRLGKTALGRLLKKLGLSNQRLKRQLSNRECWPTILQDAQKQNGVVFYLRITQTVPITSISAVPPTGNVRFMLYERRVTTNQLKAFLQYLISSCEKNSGKKDTRKKRVLLIAADNAETLEIINKKPIQDFLKNHSRQIQLHDSTSVDKKTISDDSRSLEIKSPEIKSPEIKHSEIKKQIGEFPPKADSYKTPPLIADLEAWTLLINQSLLDIDYPFGNFLQALNIHFDCSAIIIPNIHIPTSPLRPAYAYTELKPLSDLQKTILMNDSTLKYWGTNPLINALEKPGDLLQIGDVITQEEWPDNIFCQGQLEITGGRYFDLLALCFAGPENTLCALLMFRSPDRHYFNHEEKQFIQRLRPHLETAMAITVTYMRNSYTLTALEEATEHMDIATLILDGEQQIIKSNGAARELLAQKNNLHEANKRLRFNDTASQKVFEKAVQKAIRWRQAPLGEKPVEAFQLRYQPNHGGKNTFENQHENNIGVLVQPITPPSFVVPHSSVVSPHVVVYISNPDKKRETPQLQLIVQLFNLSQREARLATLITEGCSLDEAAEAMNITQATARTYLQHVYEKTGVRRRQDLVQRVLKSVALLA